MLYAAIIGAGPGGIIAARKLLETGQFEVAIFEKGPAVGGLWSDNGLIDPQMRTNLANSTVSFSDLSWDSVHLKSGGIIPVFPRAAHVKEYLEHYFRRFIPEDSVSLNTNVVRVERIPSQSGNEMKYKWRLFTHKTDGREATEVDVGKVFDYLVVAPGFFAHANRLDGMASIQNSASPILHSTEYRRLEDIFPAGNASEESKPRVLVVGGSHSGSDSAASIALQSSSSKYSPTTHSSGRGPIDCEIVHVTSHEMYALPPFLRNTESESCAFQPMDFVLYNRSNRPLDPPPTFAFALANPEKSAAGRKMIGSLSGVGNGPSEGSMVDDLPPYAVISETYPQFVESGYIKPVIGSLAGLEKENDTGLLKATVISPERETRFEHISAVVYATGFDTAMGFSFLPSDVKSDLGFDGSCSRAPLLLTNGYLSQNDTVPNLAVIGFPGSPWGILEMQARAAAKRWTGDDNFATNRTKTTEVDKLQAYYQELREATDADRRTALAQNPFGDYLGLMEQASRELSLQRVDLNWEESKGPICPARYIDSAESKDEAMKTMSRLEQTQRATKESGLFIARAAFHGWLGKWSANYVDAEGKQRIAEVNFHPRLPTSPDADFEYLCIDTLDGHQSRTVYRYEEAADQITAWSVRSSDNLSADCMRSRLDFGHSDVEGDSDTAAADEINVNAVPRVKSVLRFRFKGASLKGFSRVIPAVGEGLYRQTFRRY